MRRGPRASCAEAWLRVMKTLSMKLLFVLSVATQLASCGGVMQCRMNENKAQNGDQAQQFYNLQISTLNKLLRPKSSSISAIGKLVLCLYGAASLWHGQCHLSVDPAALKMLMLPKGDLACEVFPSDSESAHLRSVQKSLESVPTVCWAVDAALHCHPVQHWQMFAGCY